MKGSCVFRKIVTVSFVAKQAFITPDRCILFNFADEVNFTGPADRPVILFKRNIPPPDTSEF